LALTVRTVVRGGAAGVVATADLESTMRPRCFQRRAVAGCGAAAVPLLDAARVAVRGAPCEFATTVVT
jgi:hypothetical protein